MEHQVVVSDQLADDSYIERLFPKCPPRQAAYAKRRASREVRKRRQTKSKLSNSLIRRAIEARRAEQSVTSGQSAANQPPIVDTMPAHHQISRYQASKIRKNRDRYEQSSSDSSDESRNVRKVRAKNETNKIEQVNAIHRATSSTQHHSTPKVSRETSRKHIRRHTKGAAYGPQHMQSVLQQAQPTQLQPSQHYYESQRKNRQLKAHQKLLPRSVSAESSGLMGASDANSGVISQQARTIDGCSPSIKPLVNPILRNGVKKRSVTLSKLSDASLPSRELSIQRIDDDRVLLDNSDLATIAGVQDNSNNINEDSRAARYRLTNTSTSMITGSPRPKSETKATDCRSWDFSTIGTANELFDDRSMDNNLMNERTSSGLQNPIQGNRTTTRRSAESNATLQLTPVTADCSSLVYDSERMIPIEAGVATGGPDGAACGDASAQAKHEDVRCDQNSPIVTQNLITILGDAEQPLQQTNGSSGATFDSIEGTSVDNQHYEERIISRSDNNIEITEIIEEEIDPLSSIHQVQARPTEQQSGYFNSTGTVLSLNGSNDQKIERTNIVPINADPLITFQQRQEHDSDIPLHKDKLPSVNNRIDSRVNPTVAERVINNDSNNIITRHQVQSSEQLLTGYDQNSIELDRAQLKTNDASTEELCSTNDLLITSAVDNSTCLDAQKYDNPLARSNSEAITEEVVKASFESYPVGELSSVKSGSSGESCNKSSSRPITQPDTNVYPYSPSTNSDCEEQRLSRTVSAGQMISALNENTMLGGQFTVQSSRRPLVPPGRTQRITSPNGLSESTSTQVLSKPSNVESPRKVGSLSPQRVKFDEDNLSSIRTSKSIGEMPSISEVQSESDSNEVQEEEDDQHQQCSSIRLERELTREMSCVSIEQTSQCSQSDHSNQSIARSSNDTDYNNSAKSPNLLKHRLPNETSHYSIRTAVSSNMIQAATTIRSSSLQFNTLSDCDDCSDEPNEIKSSLQEVRKSNYGQSVDRNCGISSSSKANSGQNLTNPTSDEHGKDDDMRPTTKTVMAFPRLDDGLSSEAESCEDDVEDDDDRAIEADDDDDDADDDDEDDDDDEEHDEAGDDGDDQMNHNMIIGNSIQSSRNNIIPRQTGSMDIYRSQQQSMLSARLRQQTHQQQSYPGSAISSSLDHSNSDTFHSMKGVTPGYTGQNQHQHDLVSQTNSGYNNQQNGSNNYWPGVTTSQPSQSSVLSPSISQRNISHGSSVASNAHTIATATSKLTGNSSASSSQNALSRDEAKSVNSRLSSDTDNETDRLLGTQRNDLMKMATNNVSDVQSNSGGSLKAQQTQAHQQSQNQNSSKEVYIEGVLFNVKYLGSTHTDCEGRGEKEDRIHQAEMAVHEVKFRNQPPTDVQLFISTEKIIVLEQKHLKVMMDHSLRTISYIADIGESVVLIVRKKGGSSNNDPSLGTELSQRPMSRITCHVFESSESSTITKSISHAFTVAYNELIKANGSGDTSGYLPKELDYQEVLNSQEMSTEDLEMFSRNENQREVVVPKREGEILGLSIVESGWGSVLPTVVIASLKQDGPAYRCKKLSVGDQILKVDGISLVGRPLSECQNILRGTKKKQVAVLTVVPCPITVEVKIKRPDTKYQLGFSVQNGVICSLLRGGIAERGGVRVGHRIMSINGTTVVGVPHEKIVNLLANSVGEIRMKTCLTSLYRLILGEENPVHF